MSENKAVEGYIKYLAAKKSIDDRSLNHHVWSCMLDTVGRDFDTKTLRVLEIGCGIGTMVERFLQHWSSGGCEYIAIDIEPAFIEHAQKRIQIWAAELGFEVENPSGNKFNLRSSHDIDHRVEFVVGDVRDIMLDPKSSVAYDLIICHAFLDLIDVDEVVPPLLALLHPGGYFYFTLVFDGVTEFLPAMEDVEDALILDLYHRSMDERRVEGAPSGHSQTGRRLYGLLSKSETIFEAMGASDWVVKAQRENSDENVFLHHILEMVFNELSDNPLIEPTVLQKWIHARQNQVDKGELLYIAHQLDYFGLKK